MKLSKKTFLYSIGISTLLVSMIVIYFVTMLPSLYVDYMKKQYLESIVEVEKGYMKKRSYEGLKVQNPTGSATLEIPFQGEEIYLAGVAFRMTMTVEDEDIKLVLNQVREFLKNIENASEEDFDNIDWELLGNAIKKSAVLNEEAPIKVKVHLNEQAELMKTADGKIHSAGKDIYVFEGGAIDGANEYISYIAVGKTEDAVIVSFLPVMSPQMRELTPIVLGSVPMMAAVIFLIVMICSQYFSKKIVDPVIRLADYAEEVKCADNMEITPLTVKGKDEIADLGRTLNELYAKLRENYEKLQKENKRQEVFLRASSHQLKTPVTAALLLVDGMIQEVGKYKDTKTYLPQVKEQLQSMSKIVEDILYLNHCAEHLEPEKVDMNEVVREIVEVYRIPMEAKQLKVELTGTRSVMESDRELLKKMLDNLFSNAVAYTEEKGEIIIEVLQEEVHIFNKGARIDEELLAHIYEPFVSSVGNQRGKGLGLYVTAYYSELLDLKLTVENTEDGVLATIKKVRDSRC